MLIRLTIIFLLVFAQAGFFSNVEAKGDEDYHRDILRALKKINARLIYLENDKLKSIQSVQENLHIRIEEIRDSLQQIQATGEINKSEMLAVVGKVETKLLDVEGHLRNEVMPEFDKQKQEAKAFRVKFSSLLVQLKNSIATDMENFSKASEKDFTAFNEGNKEKLQQIVDALSGQTEKLKQTQALFKTDLIPALDTQNKATRQALLTELVQTRAEQKNILESNYQQVVDSLTKIDDKNLKLIAVLKQSISIDEEIKNLTKAIQENIGGANKNINTASKMIGTLNQELTKVKENQRAVEPQLKILGNVARQLSDHSTKTQQRLLESIQKIDSSKAQTGVANEKLAKLIDILKAIVTEQEKIEKVLQGQEKLDVVLQAQGKVDQALQGQVHGKIDQILQSMEKLDELVQAQENLDQVLQGQVLKSITSQETISHMQQELKDALKDLRRKANVNISRNDDILKKFKKQK